MTNEDTGEPDRTRVATATQPPLARRAIHVLLIFVAFVLVADALVGDRGLFAAMRAKREYAELSVAIARQRSENARLREEARRLREDPAAIEDVARRDLQFIRPGEKVFIIKDIGQASHAQTTTPPTP